MPKMPDFSELTKKLDIQGLLDTVKSAVGAGIATPAKAPDGDQIAADFVALLTLTHTLAASHAEQAKVISDVHRKLEVLYKQVQALKLANANTIAPQIEAPAVSAVDKSAPEKE